ncbi:IS21 family transposase, partial [Alkalimonas sp. MEB108]|nr:IS21 family transposase [Alkalimonas sp. MEB108]
KSCLAILNLATKYGQDRLEAACLKALLLEQPHRKVILNLLINNKERELSGTDIDEHPMMNHHNIRGQHYYQ